MSVRFFLGANSGDGFYSLYDNFACSPGDRLYLIKGGPGCGKSTFMKKLASRAENLGYDAQYILCSGDPDSLDGVYIPALRLGFADATAPHVLEPRIFAGDSCYVNLGQFCSWQNGSKTAEYNTKYKQMYETAYAFLSAAKSVKKVCISGLIDKNIIDSVQNRAEGALRRELGRARPKMLHGTAAPRFISGISCVGKVCLSDTVEKLCKRIYIVDDRFGLADIYLKHIAHGTAQRGIDAIVCPCPLCPDELEAILLPEHSLGFVSARIMQPDKPWRHVRLDALVDRDAVSAHKSEIKQREKLLGALLDSGIMYLAKAKQYHDLLEAEYKPLIDFAALSEFTNNEAAKLIK